MGRYRGGAGGIAVASLFALSCIGLLLFLWNSFGGTLPLQAKGYRATLVLPDASNVVKETEVRISGVHVGSVIDIRRSGSTARAVLEIEPRFAPLRSDVRAILRRKSLLGEAYLELTPGTRTALPVPDGGTIAASRVTQEVAVDKVLSGFDAPTRRALQDWLAGWEKGLAGRAADLSVDVNKLAGATQAGGDLLGELRRQRAAVTTLVRDTGVTFQAIGSQQADIDRLITNARALLSTTAASDRELRGTIRALPGFLDGLRSASRAVTRISRPLTPVLTALRPAGRSLPGVLAAATSAGSELTRIAGPLDSVTKAAPAGLTAGRRILDSAGPLITQLRPFARQTAPMIEFSQLYRQELVQSWLQVAAATNGVADNQNGDAVHYLRAPAVFPNEALIGAGVKAPFSRSNPYMAPRGIDNLAEVLKTFSCGNTKNPQTTPPLVLPAPPCIEQGPITFQGRSTSYPQLRQAP